MLKEMNALKVTTEIYLSFWKFFALVFFTNYWPQFSDNRTEDAMENKTSFLFGSAPRRHDEAVANLFKCNGMVGHLKLLLRELENCNIYQYRFSFFDLLRGCQTMM